jgi:hypothetical protein
LFIFFMSGIAAIVLAAVTRIGPFHRLYLRGNPAPGLVRLGVIVAMAWIGFVIWRYADPSVTGIYVVFYLVMGYAVVKLFGQLTATLFGARHRVDVVERRNVPAALVIAAFTVATGLIFGGSLWGEADPVGDDEGGWWIPLSFFFLGWVTLLIAFGLFLRREPRPLAHRLQHERSIQDARATAAYLIAAGVALTDAVAGDFWGWRHGLLTFGVLAALVIAHEVFASLSARRGPAGSTGGVGGDATEPSAPSDTWSTLEAAVYVLLGLAAWGLNRMRDIGLGAG